MAIISEATALRLEHAISQLAQITAQSVKIARAALQQEYTLDDLQQRYHGKGRDEIRSALIRLKAIPAEGKQGKAITASLDSVLQLDAVFARRLDFPPEVSVLDRKRV